MPLALRCGVLDDCATWEPVQKYNRNLFKVIINSVAYDLLLQDPQPAEKKDFISGFTALHWAAKGGNADMVRNILNISRKRGVEVDVNSRTQAGYTPLHVAVLHAHDGVITLLVRDYGASVNIRANDGEEAVPLPGERCVVTAQGAARGPTGVPTGQVPGQARGGGQGATQETEYTK